MKTKTVGKTPKRESQPRVKHGLTEKEVRSRSQNEIRVSTSTSSRDCALRVSSELEKQNSASDQAEPIGSAFCFVTVTTRQDQRGAPTVPGVVMTRQGYDKVQK